eukprot:6268368-Pyramimonas_sp.AAC.1
MDVEGAEFSILPHLIQSEVLPLLDKIYIEWHERIDNRFFGAESTYRSIFETYGVHFHSWI